MNRVKDITGIKFGRWTPLNKLFKNKYNYWVWLLKCDCGVTKEVAIRHLTNGSSKSCGCLNREISSNRKGFKHTNETRKKISLGHLGEKNHNWKGGVYDKRKNIYHSVEYKIFRETVLKRDNYTCQICYNYNYKGNGKTVTLNVDHIKPFAYFPELRFDINNGRTLCVDCHRKTDTFGGRAVNYKKQHLINNYG